MQSFLVSHITRNWFDWLIFERDIKHNMFVILKSIRWIEIGFRKGKTFFFKDKTCPPLTWMLGVGGTFFFHSKDGRNPFASSSRWTKGAGGGTRCGTRSSPKKKPLRVVSGFPRTTTRCRCSIDYVVPQRTHWKKNRYNPAQSCSIRCKNKASKFSPLE